MRLAKTFGFAGAMLASALLGGTLIGSAFATEDPTDPTTSSDSRMRGEYCDVFLDTFAGELGTDRDGLVVAGQAAANAAVDAALEAGDLTEERAAAMRERIAAHDGSGCGHLGLGFVRGFHAGAERGFARGFLGGNVMESAADALGIDSADVIGQARDAGSLEALAEAEGVAYADVKAAVIAAVQADLDAAVGEGMSQERADAAIERITQWLDEGGTFDELKRFGPGGRHHDHGPWGDRDASGSEDDESSS